MTVGGHFLLGEGEGVTMSQRPEETPSLKTERDS